MCGRFAQSMTREDYLALLADEADRDIPYDPEPIGRFNVVPGTKVLLLSERDEQLHLDPVFWGCLILSQDKQQAVFVFLNAVRIDQNILITYNPALKSIKAIFVYFLFYEG